MKVGAVGAAWVPVTTAGRVLRTELTQAALCPTTDKLRDHFSKYGAIREVVSTHMGGKGRGRGVSGLAFVL